MRADPNAGASDVFVPHDLRGVVPPCCRPDAQDLDAPQLLHAIRNEQLAVTEPPRITRSGGVGWLHAEAVGQVRALALTRGTYERLLSDAVRSACELGVPRGVLADALGIHRATFYRQFRDVLGQRGSS